MSIRRFARVVYAGAVHEAVEHGPAHLRLLRGALAGQALAQEHEVARADLAFEYLLGALRLVDGFDPREFVARTGLAPSAIETQLAAAEAQGWITREPARIAPTTRGLDFLSDLQALFLP
jgi:oxygen-independent coproporphyrinogen-3 oxidase